MKKSGFGLKKTSKCIAAVIVTQVIAFSAIADVKDQALFYKPSYSNQLIVKFKRNQANIFSHQRQVESTLSSISTQLNVDIQMHSHMGSGATLVQINSNTQTVEEAATALQSRPDIEYAVPNIRLHTMATPNDPRYNEQWHYFEPTAGINLPTALDIAEGAGAVVAVIDTGYRPHADLAANIIAGYDFVSNAKNARDNDGRDPDAKDEGDWFGFLECPGTFQASNSSWHGTHVAGTIAASTNNAEGVAGIAGKAKILPVRVLAKCGGSLADIQDGMLWAAGISVPGVPDNTNPADIINLSLGGASKCDRSMQDVVNQVTAAGTTVIAAAGNSNANASGFTPASCDNVITVASVNRSGAKASYSNYGKVVDIAAPGGETASGRGNGILSTLNSGKKNPEADSYAFYQGTSMATPHVAGVAALMVSHKPDITPTELKKVMQDTARSFPSTCNDCGTGIVDATATLNALTGGGNLVPNANFSFSNNALTLSFTDTSSDRDGHIVRWSWDFGDGNSSTAQNPVHTYSNAGVFQVSLTVTDNEGASDSDSQNISVNDNNNQIPSAAFTFSVNDLTVTFTDNSKDNDGQISAWLWDFGDGSTSTQQNPVHTYAAKGNYNVILTASDNLGASNSTTQKITVTAPDTNITLKTSKVSILFFTRIYLKWSKMDGTNVDLYRNGVKSSVENTGAYSELVLFFGSNTYKVCVTGSNICSNESTVKY